jgi:tetratricopeptide (TPR) repeat protein
MGTPVPSKFAPPIDVKSGISPDLEVEKGETPDIHEAQGVKIEVKQPKFSVSEYMEQAYNAQRENDLSTAMSRYQDILEVQPKNDEARFGLASTYHRMGELAMARDLYADILENNPKHKEALNNLLVLVSQESPTEAMAALKQLGDKNPDFAPIFAQMSALYAKKKDFENASAAMAHAIKIDPKNLAYRYNAAVLMDRMGNHKEAIALYSSLKQSYRHGENIPADIAVIQERLTFLLSNRG